MINHYTKLQLLVGCSPRESGLDGCLLNFCSSFSERESFGDKCLSCHPANNMKGTQTVTLASSLARPQSFFSH